MAERSHPTYEARVGGQEESPCVRGQGRQPGGVTLHPRRGAAARKINPCPVLAKEDLKELSHVEGQEGRW